jgi:hypothetical protein
MLYGGLAQMREQSSGVQLVLRSLASFCKGALAKIALHIVAFLSVSVLLLAR